MFWYHFSHSTDTNQFPTYQSKEPLQKYESYKQNKKPSPKLYKTANVCINVRVSRVPVATVTVEKQQVFHFMSVSM